MADKKYKIITEFVGVDNTSDEINKINQGLSGLNRQQAQTQTTTEGSTRSWQGFGAALAGAGIAFATAQAAQLYQEMLSVGGVAVQTEARFLALVSSIGDADAVLSQLRQTTNNIVDDTTLQQAASDYLARGLATTQGELNTLIELAVKLKQPTDSASEAVENFGLLLANESVARLDSFGISAARVRERINELLASGEAATRSDAFRLAVMEQGAVALERLGASADAGAGGLARLSTRWDNFFGAVSVATFSFTDQLATTVDQLFEISEFIAENGVDVFNETLSGEAFVSPEVTARLQDRIGQFASAGYIGTETFNDAQLAGVARYVQRNPEMARQISESLPIQSFALAGDAGLAGTGFDAAQLDDLSLRLLGLNLDSLDFDNMVDLETAIVAAYDALQDYNREQERNAQTARVITGIQSGLNDALSVGATLYDTLAEGARRVTSEEYERVQTQQMLYDEFVLINELGQLEVGSNSFFNPLLADELVDRASELKDNYEELKAIAESSEYEFVTEDEVDNARALADQAQRIATDAERAALAYENANLTTLLGQGSGGAFGELGDRVLGGLSEEQRAEFERTLGLASGRQTETSVYFEETVVPLLQRITEQVGVDEGVGATQRALEALQQGQILGLNADQLQEYIVQEIGYRLSESDTPMIEVTVGANDTPIGIANRLQAQGLDVTWQDVIAQAGITDPRLLRTGLQLQFGQQSQLTRIVGEAEAQPLDEMFTSGLEGTETTASESTPLEDTRTTLAELQETATLIDEQFTDIESSSSTILDDFTTGIEDAQTTASEFGSELDDIANGNYTAQIHLEVLLADSTGFELASLPGFSDAVARVVRNNGGIVPETINGR